MEPETLYPEVKRRLPAIYSVSEASPSTPQSSTLRPGLHSRSVTGRSDKTIVPTNGFFTGKQTVSEELEDYHDATSDLHDQLIMGNKAWWILEILPLTHRFQKDENDEWVVIPT